MPYYRKGADPRNLDRERFSRSIYFKGEQFTEHIGGQARPGVLADTELHIAHYPGEEETFIPHTQSEYESMVSRVPKGGQIPMFEHHSEPGRASVDYASGTEAGRIHFPILLAIAQNDYNKIGRTLVPSHDLSPHSLKLTEHLSRRGLVDKSDVPNGISNDMTFEDAPEFISEEYVTEIPGEEVKQGKKLLRGMLGRDKPLSKQFEKHTQLSMFDD